MQSVQWPVEVILILILLGLALMALGFLIAFLLYRGNAAKHLAQLVQFEQELQKAEQQRIDLQLQLKRSENLLNEKEVTEAKLQTLLSSAEATEKRLNAELAERKSELNSLDNTVQGIRQACHEAENKLGSAQSEIRALSDQTNELRERLAHTEESVTAERSQTASLKESLAQEGKRAESLQGTIDSSRHHFNEIRENLTNEKAQNAQLQNTHQELLRAHTQLKTEMDEREASHSRELASFNRQKESLAEQFKLLSNEILEAKTKSLQESSQQTLTSVMNPFQQSIDSFKKEVQEIHHRETTQQGELRQELASLKELNQKITTEAHQLSTALRGQKKLQGNWGELVLENVLDRSGLQKGKDYVREESFTTDEGRQRPDAVIYLPQNKHLIVDAKVSLNAYTRYVNAEDDLERAQALKEHVAAVASRIKELAIRDYYKLPGLNSPDMVFMFIPIESAFVEALKADETLFQQAIENNVLVATPTTLLTSLNIVRQLWRYEDQNKHTAELANKAEAVFKKLNNFLASFEKIKKGLENATEAYGKAENQLISGKGNLVKQVSDFKNLAPAIKAELPDYFTDKANLEIDFIPAEQNASHLDSQIPSPDEQDTLEETN